MVTLSIAEADTRLPSSGRDSNKSAAQVRILIDISPRPPLLKPRSPTNETKMNAFRHKFTPFHILET